MDIFMKIYFMMGLGNGGFEFTCGGQVPLNLNEISFSAKWTGYDAVQRVPLIQKNFLLP